MKTLTKLLKTSIKAGIIISSLMFQNILFAHGINSTKRQRINLGLYGGPTTDLTYSSQTGNRLFAGVESPSSLFYTDDGCQTWTSAFPEDSLEFTLNNQSQ